MNGPEKKVFRLALALFALGCVVTFSPWDPVPQIETFSYAEGEPWNGSNILADTLGILQKSTDSLHKRTKSLKKAKPAVHFPISINRATAAELCAIKGVGPKLAERIIAYRSSHGKFSGPSDLRKVSGIGKKKAENILGFVVFD